MSVKPAGPLTIGLDIGIASVGWAVLAPDRIVALGVRAFDKAENEKGEPLNLARRMARTARTRLERRALRLKRLRRLLRDAGVVPSANSKIFATPPRSRDDPINDPWHLRAQALDRRLAPEEWARVLYHLVKHRGFFAARKSEMVVEANAKEEKNKEKQGLLAGVKRTAQLLGTSEQPRYRTLGELAAKDETFALAKRNKAGAYTNSFSRLLLREELGTLFNRQRELGNPKADESLHAQVDQLFWYQKPALSGDAMLKLLGRCTFEKDEYRAAKHTWSTERFVWLTRINNLRITHNGERRALTETERRVAIDLPYVQKTQPVTYKHLRKALNKTVDFPAEAGFAGLSYRRDSKKDPEDEKLGECKGWHELRKALERAQLDKSWLRFSQDHALLDAIGTALSIFKTDDELRLELAKLALADAETEALLSVSFSDFIQLSIKALRKILPHMETGKRYDEACEAAGYNHSQPTSGEIRGKLLPPLFREELRQAGNRKKVVRIPILVKNPVVSRSLNQARKVLNALIREYGSPIAVHIELGRDLSRSYEERREIKKGQDRFKDEKDSAVKLFKETFDGREPSARNQDLPKFRFYREQEGQCAYSQEPLDIARLLEIGYVEIDHALPYSRSFDDTQNNKVLVLSKENRDKGGRTPYEYLDGASDSERWRRFEAWVRGHKGLRRAKRERLLRREFDEREAREFAARNLTDTRYATRYFSNFVKQNLRFAEGAGEVPVLTPSGAFTSFLRARWGIIKSREQSDLHHALDACVVAAASHKLIKRVSDFHRRDELVQLADGKFADRVTGEILSAEVSAELGLHFPKPWEDFRDELLARLSSDPKTEITPERHPQYSADDIAGLRPIWVSRAPKRRNGGALHQETIRSAKLMNKGLSYVSVKLQDLKLSNLDDIVGAYRLDADGNRILNVEGNPVPDPRNAPLFELLRQRLQGHAGDGKKAFAEPVYKPSAQGKQAPLVRTVKLISTQKGGVRVRGGVADQASMWRTDVFEKGGKFYLVPIYQSDRRKGAELPNRAVFQGKPRELWPIVDDTYRFLFSLCLNDPVRLRQKNAEFVGYFSGLDVATGNISVWSHDRNLSLGKDGLFRGLGPKTALAFEKFHVDVLGNLYPAAPEKRHGMA
jgi:CRISPR-associated endonuclease Csn1